MPKTIGPTEWSRSCPECQQTIYYGGRQPLNNAESRGSRCPSCSNKGKNNGMYGRTGEFNPFYGRNHTEAVKQAMSIQTKSWYLGLSDDQKDAMLKNLELGHTNETPRLSNYEYNVLKHGREGADKRHLAFKEKLSKRMSGEGNPMYGRPTPKGAGVGWSGWYLGVYFRSLRELSFMVHNPDAEPAESKKWRAAYTEYTGAARTTVPDFVVESSKTVFECKPAALHNSPSVLDKAEAMKTHVANMGYSYVIVDPEIIPTDLLVTLIDSGMVVLDTKTKERFEKWQINV